MKTKFILLFLSLVLCACSKSDDESKNPDINIITDFNTTRGTAPVAFDESPIPVGDMFVSVFKNSIVNITYLSPSLDAFLNTVIDQGMSKRCAKMIGGFAAATRHGELESDGLQMEKLLGRKPLIVKQYLEETFICNFLSSVG